MATDLKTQYVIELLEQGTGAKTAVADLKAVSAAAKETTVATETMTAATAASSAAFTVSAGQMKSAARTLSADLKLLALVSFPDVAAKGFVAEAALKAIGSTSKLLGFSVAGVTGSMALLLPIIQSGTEAWKAHKAKLQEVRTEFDAFAASITTNVAAVAVLARLSAAGVVSDERRNLLGMILDRGQPGPKRQAIQEIIGLQYQSGKDTAAMGQWQGAAGLAEGYVGGTLTGVEGQTFSATKAWTEARQAVLNYKKEGVDTELALKQIDEAYAAVIERIHQEKIDNLQKEDMREVESRSRRIQEEQAEAQHVKSFQDDLLEATLSGDERERFANLRTFQERMKQIQQLSLAEKISGPEEIDLINDAGAAYERQDENIKSLKNDTSDFGRVLDQSFQIMASTGAHAFVGLITGAKGLKAAFADMLKTIAETIMQLVLLRALKSVFGGAAEGGVFPAARGGVFAMAGGGIAGVDMVSSPTFFPKFNVLAGEAGAEWLTVLSRPRMMEIGGIQAAVGNAGRNQLALTNAADLQRARPGPVEINITLDPGLRAEITNDASQAAVIRVNTNLKQDTDTSRAVKALTS